MHSLPVLLIALALLPLSAAHTCHAGVSFTGFPPAIQTDIDAELASAQPSSNCGTDHCITFMTKFTDDKETVTLTMKGCLNEELTCASSGACMEGKETIPYEGKKYTLSGAICCCIGSNCSPPMPTPVPVKVSSGDLAKPQALLAHGNAAPTATAFLLLAAVAALIAARG